MAKPTAFDEIKKHEESIAALKSEAVATLKAERASLEKQAQAIAIQIAQLTGRAPEEKPRRTRRPSVAVSIDDIVKHIKAGAINNNQLAKATGASSAKIKAVVAKEGKKAGISSSGERSKFAYFLK